MKRKKTTTTERYFNHINAAVGFAARMVAEHRTASVSVYRGRKLVYAVWADTKNTFVRSLVFRKTKWTRDLPRRKNGPNSDARTGHA